MFFSCRGAKQGWAGVPAYVSLHATPCLIWELIAMCIESIIGGKVNVCCCCIFGHVQLLRFVIAKIFWSCFNPKFGHIYSVMWISLPFLIFWYYTIYFYNYTTLLIKNFVKFWLKSTVWCKFCCTLMRNFFFTKIF